MRPRRAASPKLTLRVLALLFAVLEGLSQEGIPVATPVFDPATPPQIVAASACAIEEETGRILYAKNIDEKRPVASTQKLLTALLIAEAGNLDAKIAVETTDGDVPPRNLWITKGSYYTRRELLEMMLVRSFNDVTKCLARDHSGGQEQFAVAMQARAGQLRMLNSSFKNAHGLPAEGQFSTARDMIVLALAAWSNQTVRDIVGIEETTFTYHGAKTIPVENSNELLRRYPECVGMKTGYTEDAGRCLVAAAKRGEKTVLAVILGSTEEAIWTDSETVLRWALEQ